MLLIKMVAEVRVSPNRKMTIHNLYYVIMFAICLSICFRPSGQKHMHNKEHRSSSHHCDHLG